jgi:hypothetical protein
VPRAGQPLDAARLSTRERALTVMALVHHTADAPAVLARLAGTRGAACLEVARELLGLAGPDRAALLAREAARLFARLPPGLARIHPTWLAAALADAPAGVRQALVEALPPALRDAVRAEAGMEPTRPPPARPPVPVLAWLRRRAWGGLCAMPEGEPLTGLPADLEDLPLCASGVLEERLAELGLARAAVALSGAPRSALAALCARLTPAHAAALVAAVGATQADAAAGRVALADLADLAGTVPGGADGRALLALLGARVLGATVAGRGDLPRQIAQRLPLPLGRALLAAAGEALPAARAEPLAGTAGALPPEPDARRLG